MNKLFLILTLASTTIPLLATHAQADSKMNYVNQRGSQLEITLHPTSKNAGTVSGSFKTAVANPNCQDRIGKPEPISGFYSGNAITLSLSYPSCGAIVAMAGNFNKDKKLEMLWITATQGQETAGKDWNTRLIGHDEYKPAPPK